ncbi:MAG: choloylglycine hydrolase [Eubacteriales bacterium]|nr:choloylglycine hydrolase [Eubacteriales bacterium]
MCTAITYTTKDHYFGRNLDLEYSYDETVTVVPRNFPLVFRHKESINKHYAIIGMAYVVNGYPLYYDAINEMGVGMAGLNFPDNCHYNQCAEDKDNIAPFEFIPYILANCKNICEVKDRLKNINIINENFSNNLPLTPLHWIITDKNETIVVEQIKDGLKIYDNPVGVLTNNPSFDMQLFALNNYINLTVKQPECHFSDKAELFRYSRGMGAIGLPGDVSSQSRFVRAAFNKLNSKSGEEEVKSVEQFFHILGSVEQIRGCNEIDDSKYEITVYSSCANLDKGVYYYTTYNNRRITAIDMHKVDLDGSGLTQYSLVTDGQILCGN